MYRGFACPQEQFHDNFLEIVAVGYARAICQAFLERFGEDLNRRGSGVTSLIAAWLEHDTVFNHVWNLAFGEVKRSLMLRDQSDHVRAAAALALQLQYCGYLGTWECQLPSPTRLRWGHWLLPSADWISVTDDEQEIFARLRYKGLEKRTTFRWSEGKWKVEGAEELPQVDTERRYITLLLPSALEDSAFDGVRPDVARNLAPLELQAACDAALQVLSNYAPIYLPWVERVIRGIVPLRTENDLFKSGSNDYRPGVIGLSFPSPALVLAELLVHESAHQYFYLLSRVGSVDDGSDPTLYYSPIKQTGRPIQYILLAYHAFANVLLFYRLCREGGIADSEYCRRKEERLFPQLKQLETSLRTTQALTPLGLALWKPLAEQMG